MGMTCTVYRATDEEIDRLLEEPAGLADFLDPDDASAPRVRTVRPKGLLGLALRLFPITITEVVADPRAAAAPRVIYRDRSVDIGPYPDAIWTRRVPEEDSPREWLLECFADLRWFISQVAATHDGVIVHIG